MANPNLDTALTKRTEFNTSLVAEITALAAKQGTFAVKADIIDGNNKIKAELLPFALSDLLVMKDQLLATTPDTSPVWCRHRGLDSPGQRRRSGLNIDGITEVKVGDWLWFIDGKWHRMPFSAGRRQC